MALKWGSLRESAPAQAEEGCTGSPAGFLRGPKLGFTATGLCPASDILTYPVDVGAASPRSIQDGLDQGPKAHSDISWLQGFVGFREIWGSKLVCLGSLQVVKIVGPH